VTRSFDVLFGEDPPALALAPVPLGEVTFSASAYPVACSAVGPAVAATWLSAPETARVHAGVPLTVQLELRPAAGVNGEVDFQPTVLEVSAGYTTAVALVPDGTLRSWGSAAVGDLGNGKYSATHATPVGIAGPFSAVGVSSGYFRSTAWSAKQLMGWGLGPFPYTAVNTQFTTPTYFMGPWSDIADVVHGHLHSCLRSSDGRTFCWGNNAHGQVGLPTSTTWTSTPKEIVGLKFRSLAAGSSSTCGATGDGLVYCWGASTYGQLGDNNGGSGPQPRQVHNMGAVRSIAAGSNHACAVWANGELWCWGQNIYGQIGDATFTQRPVANRTTGPQDYVAVTAGERHTCGLTSGGTVRCWGNNKDGQLGTGTTLPTWAPAEVLGLSDVVAISALPGGFTTCAQTASGEAWCWGQGTSGQLGNGALFNEYVPVQVNF
jgi:alpha-tubulin suppressor-like RCC1 family protein